MTKAKNLSGLANSIKSSSETEVEFQGIIDLTDSTTEIDIDSFKLTGGTSGSVLTTDGAGTLSWTEPTPVAAQIQSDYTQTDSGAVDFIKNKPTLGTAAATDSSAYATASHEHAASDITSGTLATARLGSGTADATTYLRGDQTWATVSAGGASSLDGLSDAATDTTNMMIGRNTVSGTNNTSLGVGSLSNNTTGTNNTANGRNALSSNTTGGRNTAIGDNSLQANAAGWNNTAIGANTLQTNTTGSWNVAIGWTALYSNTDENNTAVGTAALFSTTTGGSNTALGREALYSKHDRVSKHWSRDVCVKSKHNRNRQYCYRTFRNVS